MAVQAVRVARALWNLDDCVAVVEAQIESCCSLPTSAVRSLSVDACLVLSGRLTAYYQ